MTSTVVWVCQEIMGIYHQFMASLKRKDSGHMFLGRGQVGRPSSGAVPVDTYQSDQLRIRDFPLPCYHTLPCLITRGFLLGQLLSDRPCFSGWKLPGGCGWDKGRFSGGDTDPWISSSWREKTWKNTSANLGHFECSRNGVNESMAGILNHRWGVPLSVWANFTHGSVSVGWFLWLHSTTKPTNSCSILEPGGT